MNSMSSVTIASMSGSSSSRSPGWYMSATSTSENTPARISLTLPLPRSSAGHPTTRTRPRRSGARSRSARNARLAAVPMRLCPQAWPTPGSASYSPRIATTGAPAPNSAANSVSTPPAPRVTEAPSPINCSASALDANRSSYASSGRSWMRRASSSSAPARASTRSATRALSSAVSIGEARLARSPAGTRREDGLGDEETRHDETAGDHREPVDDTQEQQQAHDRGDLYATPQRRGGGPLTPAGLAH